ncbi:MAG: hypothetical protein DRN25_02085 [Thermoplasmata archaeon]|nr:MAG: hypothetical protein DRN18_01930 [Thermoplasmata archaeon]RLF60686.1 MAG: hypothetical protein DRN25_02085 [Thermoplasmata archaeon]HDH86880.1 ABC transporter permease [Desulfobacteraceae bacterium]
MDMLSRVFRNVVRKKVRTALIVVALGFCMAILISIQASITANQESLQEMKEENAKTLQSVAEEINRTASIIEVFPGGGMWEFGGPFINESIAYNISSIEGVEDAIPILERFIFPNAGNMTKESTDGGVVIHHFMALYKVEGIQLNSSHIDRILPTKIIKGRNLKKGDSGVVILSQNLTKHFDAGVGDTITINGIYFEVVGVFESTLLTSRTLYMSLSDAQRVFNLTGKVSKINVYVEDVDRVEEIANEIETNYGLNAITYLDKMNSLLGMREHMKEREEKMARYVDQLQSIGFQEFVTTLIAASVMVLFIMLYAVRERTKEIGILKAIGFTGNSILIQFLLEGIVIGFMGGVVGAVIGGIATPMLANILLPKPKPITTPSGHVISGIEAANPIVTPEMILLVIGIAVLLGGLGSLYPAWKASRKSPVEAIRYE